MCAAKRPSIPTGEAFKVWLDAAGRCTFCNQLVAENEVLGEAVKIGELAHNVGWSEASPRGSDSGLSEDEKQLAENLCLACRNCHKPIDDGGVVGRYTVAEIAKRKREHEDRIRTVTSIGSDRRAHVVRFAGTIRSVHPAMSRTAVLRAATDAGLYPARLGGAFHEDIELDIRHLGDPTYDEAENTVVRREISKLVSRIHDGIRADEVDRVALFAFGRIPHLVQLGARLGDKCPLTIFNRHRNDDQPWTWPSQELTLHLATETVRLSRESESPTLVISLSGRVNVAEVAAVVPAESTIYEIRPTEDRMPEPGVVRSSGDLAALEREVRSFFAHVGENHPEATEIHLVAAVGLGAAVVIGRAMMRDVTPPLLVYDRADGGGYELAMRTEP